MWLDLRYLVECVTSPLWAWTVPGVDRLLRSLGLAELPAGRDGNKRHFKAATGLPCTVIADDTTQDPVRIEFPFEVAPMTGVPRAELLEAHFALLYASAQGALGQSSDPTVIIERGLAAVGRASWRLDSCTMAIEVRRATAESGDLVVLSLER
jgi:hypothetical protein